MSRLKNKTWFLPVNRAVTFNLQSPPNNNLVNNNSGGTKDVEMKGNPIFAGLKISAISD